MARQRFIWPDLWEDEDFGRLSHPERLLFIALFSNADDEGRLVAHPAHLRAVAFRFDELPLPEIASMRDHLASSMKNVHLYEVEGKPYIQLTSWAKRQKPKYPQPSRIPSPPGHESGSPARWYVPAEVRRQVMARDNYRCVTCGSPDDLQVDHVIPLKLGGTSDPSNLQVLCGPCNRKKRDQLPASTPDNSSPDSEGHSPDLEEPSSNLARGLNGLTEPSAKDDGSSSVGWDGMGREENIGHDPDGSRPDDPVGKFAEPEPGTRSRATPQGFAYPSDFEEWWTTYPRKNQKRQAYAKYQARLREGWTADQLLQAARHMRDSGRDGPYIPYGKTFLGPDVAEWVKGIADPPPKDRTGDPLPDRAPRPRLTVSVSCFCGSEFAAPAPGVIPWVCPQCSRVLDPAEASWDYLDGSAPETPADAPQVAP